MPAILSPRSLLRSLPTVALILSFSSPAMAGGADVVAAEAKQAADGTWRFSVTVKHPDEGWDHYANSWQVLSEDGEVLATRVLAHPHVDEQPFTRSKSGIALPEGTTSVIVRAGDSVHGFSGRVLRVILAP